MTDDVIAEQLRRVQQFEATRKTTPVHRGPEIGHYAGVTAAVRDESDFAVVGTNFGQHHHPAWTVNLLAQPDAAIEVGPVRMVVRTELVDDPIWQRLWPRFLDIYPGFQAYLGRSGGRKPRMFLLHPAGGSPGARSLNE